MKRMTGMAAAALWCVAGLPGCKEEEGGGPAPASGRVLAAVAGERSTGVCVPLYHGLWGDGFAQWQRVIDAKRAHPLVPVIAIVNANSGPGMGQSATWVTWINNLKAAGVVVLGYVPTYWAQTTLQWSADYPGLTNEQVIRLRIQNWREWYGVDGVHFDEMAVVYGREGFYRDLTVYSKSLGCTFVSGNPGMDTKSTYVGTVDNMHIYEGHGLPPISSGDTQADSVNGIAGWHTAYPKSHWAFVAYDYATTTLDAAFVLEARKYVAWMYVTRDGAGGTNPWGTLSEFFEQLVALLDAPDGTPADTTPPAAPLLLAPANGAVTSNRTPLFDWSDLTDPTAPVTYRLQVDNNADFSSREFDLSGIVTSSYAPGTALADGTYSWRVRAKDGAENIGLWSETRTIRVAADVEPPAAPLLVAPANGAVTSDRTPLFDWSDAADPTAPVTYRLQVDNNADFSSREFDLSGIATSSYAPSTALADGTYSWRVRAKDGAENIGLWSAVRTVRIDATGPALQWTAPLAGQTVSRICTLEVAAADLSGVARVDFFANGTLLFTRTAAPYRGTVSLPKHGGRTVTLSARGTDALGNVSAASIQVRVR